MDCRIIDCKVVVRDGSVVSVRKEHFGDDDRKDRYYGTVVKLIQDDKKARVKWVEDDSQSIEEVEILTLESSLPEYLKAVQIPDKSTKKKFSLRIIPSSAGASKDVDFIATPSCSKFTSMDSSTPGKCFLSSVI